MRKTKLAASLLAVSLAATTLLTGCKPKETGNSTTSNTPGNSDTSSGGSGNSGTEATGLELSYAAGTTLRMAVGYNGANTGLFFDGDTVGDEYADLVDENGEKVPEIDDKTKEPKKDKNGNIIYKKDKSKVTKAGKLKLADGKEYITGSLKPTWVEVENQLNVKFENQYQGNNSTKEWGYWKEQLEKVDFVSGTAQLLTENGPDKLVNIANYLDAMPNFKKYLEENPIVRLSITGAATGANKGSIYFSPYFDGVNDIEKMPLMRTDWVEKLLNGTEPFAAEKSGNTAAPVYKPYMPTSGKVTVDVVKADGSGVEQVTKDYDAYGNIIDKMNSSMSGVDAVNMFREYIDKTYGGYYTPENRADLFIGQNAAWDADELVALLRCVVANAQTLNGTDTVGGLFAREEDNNQRRCDMFRFAGCLFGVRGVESRQEWMYIGADGKMHDCRMEKPIYEAMERMNALVQEGLVSKDFLAATPKVNTQMHLEKDDAFMHYDYNQTQTIYNEGDSLQEGEKYMAVMVPVARWDDGDSATPDYMRFTESWRSVKSDGWGISKAGVGLTTDKKVTTQEEIDALPDKLKACLKLIDFAYTDKGMVLLSYGPDAFIKTGETFDFNGKEMPVIADATYQELWTRQNGNYTNYARRYLGSTLSFVKLQSFEYQCTTEVGKEGAAKISKAIALGTIKHPLLEIAQNPWWTSTPTVLPNTSMENEQIAGLSMLGSDGKFSTSKGKQNMYVDMIINGYNLDQTTYPGITSADAAVKTISEDWGDTTFAQLKNDAWQRLVKFYNELNA